MVEDEGAEGEGEEECGDEAAGGSRARTGYGWEGGVVDVRELFVHGAG